MSIVSLLIFLIGIGIVLLSIHQQDEVHQLVATLSGVLALVCFLLLIPIAVKGIVTLSILIVIQKELSLQDLY